MKYTVMDKVFIITDGSVRSCVIGGVGRYNSGTDIAIKIILDKELSETILFKSEYAGEDIRRKIFLTHTDALNALLSERLKLLEDAAMAVSETKNLIISRDDRSPFLKDKECPYTNCPWTSSQPGDPEPTKDCETCVSDYEIHVDDDYES